jgi:hypothetical protein
VVSDPSTVQRSVSPIATPKHPAANFPRTATPPALSRSAAHAMASVAPWTFSAATRPQPATLRLVSGKLAAIAAPLNHPPAVKTVARHHAALPSISLVSAFPNQHQSLGY